MAQRSRSAQFPPLLVAAAALLAILAVLPSALNFPLSNPSETLEYAPIPSEDEVPPAAGNLGALGLGRNPTLRSDFTPVTNSDAVGGGTAKTASTKRCVGNPPKQTEDPLSPPCVADFRGDNGGSTYQGVTRDEIRIIFFVRTGSCPNYQGCQQPQPIGEYHDLGQPEKQDQWYQDRYLRAWQRYFNDRYQTYGRYVHFIHFTGVRQVPRRAALKRPTTSTL